jgi:hypothetical protein
LMEVLRPLRVKLKFRVGYRSFARSA